MIKQIFLFIISFILILILSEIFIRTSDLASVSSTEFYDDIGRGRRIDLNYLYFNEGFGIGRFNEYRYIGEPNPPDKSKNTIRIALMGDSYVESFQVFERDYFGKIAEYYLEYKYPEKQFEFLNFGRSGFDIADIYAYQKTFVEKFHPDLILYFLEKDDLLPKYEDPLRPKTVVKNDSLLISFDFDSAEIKLFESTKLLTQHSSIINMLNIGRKKADESSILAILFDKLYLWINPNEIRMEYSEEVDFKINPVTEKIINSLDPNMIVFVNRDKQALPQEFFNLCLDNGFNYLDISIPLDSLRQLGYDPTEWKITNKRGHWNQKAHKVVGEEIARKLIYVIEYK